MRPSHSYKYDVASVLSIGKRDYQEDALASDFPLGAEFGYAVLADGMGGHAAGDVASKIAVTEVFSELKLQSGNLDELKDNLPTVLSGAANAANACVAAHTSENPEATGMGTTLVAAVFIRDQLHWISVGDSPLYLYRDGLFQQLNEDHSLAPQIDFMVKSGMMDPDVGRSHPDRNCLTSVLIGDDIERVDCPDEPFDLYSGDVLIVSSDGLQFLTDEEIERILGESHENTAEEIAGSLNASLDQLDDPDQDNAGFIVIKVVNEEGPLVLEPIDLAWDDTTSDQIAVEEVTWAKASAPDENEVPLTFRKNSSQARSG